MQKVLIISYFFSPCNFVGSYRTISWAKNLNKFGFYPIIITRQWNKNQSDIVDNIKENKYEVKKFISHEVHYLPYKKNLRDYLSNYPSFKLIQKTLTLFELIFSNFFINTLPYSNIYSYSKELIKSDKIKFLIISGRPFQAFHMGYKLKKQFNISWIPDYRDEWNSHANKSNTNILERFISKLELRSEIKWTSNCSCFISVANSCVDSISKLINKKGYVVMNGFEKFIKLDNKKSEEFTITYSGTLYEYQKIEIFINAINEISLNERIKVNFVGTNMIPKEHNRLKKINQEK